MANTNLAYDYARFEKQPKQELKKPRLVMVRSQPRAFASAFSARTVCAFIFVVTMLCLIVYNQVCINEVNGEINRLGGELTILESENVRFMSLLESTISMRAVAKQAEEELGMNKLDQYQTVYVYIYEQDQIILAKSPGENDKESGLLAMLSKFAETFTRGDSRS